jgi:murein tripeptide amidase MpaA
MDFNHYYKNDELEDVLQQWAARYPALVTLESIGQSYEKRPIWLVTVTNQATRPEGEKPAIWLDANIHATELAGTTALLYILHHLLTGYGDEERITRLLDGNVLYVVPRINPDGANQALADSPRFIRSGVRPYPHQDQLPGLIEQDIDQDGRILQMRILDSAGDWKINALDPRLMEKRRPDENGGVYYRLLTEGIIKDYDGFTIPVPPNISGLDFNRNFPFQWRPEIDQRGAGDYPASEPEIQAVTRFFSAHRNINIALTFHTYSRVLLRPYSTRPDDQMDFGDVTLYKRLGKIGTELTGYPNYSTYHDFRFEPGEITYGAFDDWVYDQFGVIAFTVELWDLADEAGVKKKSIMEWFAEHPIEDDLTILRWADENIGPGGYIDWYKYDHPQLGRVELGGWNVLTTWRNPPANRLQSEVERHLAFVLALGDTLPSISIPFLDAKRLGENTWAVRAGIENTGYLPAFTTNQARKQKAVRPVRAAIDLPPGARLVEGRNEVEIGHLEGRSNKFGIAIDPTPTDHRGLALWLVEADPGTLVTVTVHAERAGIVRKSLALGDATSNNL